MACRSDGGANHHDCSTGFSSSEQKKVSLRIKKRFLCGRKVFMDIAVLLGTAISVFYFMGNFGYGDEVTGRLYKSCRSWVNRRRNVS